MTEDDRPDPEPCCDHAWDRLPVVPVVPVDQVNDRDAHRRVRAPDERLRGNRPSRF